MSKLNPTAFSFVPGQRFATPQQSSTPPALQPIVRPEQTEAPPPPPTISLNIGSKPSPHSATPTVLHPIPAPVKNIDESHKPATKTAKADVSAPSKTFTTEKAKTDTTSIAQDVRNAADQAVLEDLFGTCLSDLTFLHKPTY
jgi:peptide chain release factor subunit 3